MSGLVRRPWLWFGVLLVAGGFGLLWREASYEVRSYGVLEHFLDPLATGPLLRRVTYPVTTEDVRFPLAATASVAGESPVAIAMVPSRLYLPVGMAHPPGMVVVHGIHHLGIDEPRLMSFARAVAGGGFAVLTPQVAALADYHVDAQSVATIGESTAWLERRLGTGRVALTGISFAGGLSLLAAADPRYAPHIRVLALMGAYDDLSRVSRFLVTNQAELPDGRGEPYIAYEYGALVFVYAHLAQFFSPDDQTVAHEALRDWLEEQPEPARLLLPRLGDAGRARMDLLFSHRVDDLRPLILQVIAEDRAHLEAISPAGKLAGLRVPVFILHGSADDIIPSTESLWLEREVPRQELGAALITPAFSHVDPARQMSLLDELRLVNFVAQFLHTAN